MFKLHRKLFAVLAGLTALVGAGIAFAQAPASKPLQITVRQR
jgi:hypothetical protein